MRLRSSLHFAALLLAGCAGINAPKGAVPMVAVAPQDGFGGWASIYEGQSYQPAFQGELIAVDSDSVFVLAGDSLVVRALSAVSRIRLVGYDPKAGDLRDWTFAGTVSTVSHGVVAIISAPVWMLIGGSITNAGARSSEINVPGRGRSWDSVKPYARFPQGLPADFDRSSIRPRPSVVPSGTERAEGRR